jgi:hypothetical protein
LAVAGLVSVLRSQATTTPRAIGSMLFQSPHCSRPAPQWSP